MWPSESKLPGPNRLVGCHVAALQEQLGDVAEAQLLSQEPQHGEQHDIGRVLQLVGFRASAGPESQNARPKETTLAATSAKTGRCTRDAARPRSIRSTAHLNQPAIHAEIIVGSARVERQASA
jgi:hypothetical protein